VICTLFIHGHIFTFKHLCLHSITKILRNGPKAHFPFRDAALARSGSAGVFDVTVDGRVLLDYRLPEASHPVYKKGGRGSGFLTFLRVTKP
jgi:hypothetical protein